MHVTGGKRLVLARLRGDCGFLFGVYLFELSYGFITYFSLYFWEVVWVCGYLHVGSHTVTHQLHITRF